MSRPEKIARVVVGQGKKGRRSGTAIRNKKGQLTGVKKKDARIAKGIRNTGLAALATAGVAGLSQLPSGKKEDPVVRPAGTSRKPRPVGPGRNPTAGEFVNSGTGRGAVPTRPPPPKPMKSGTGRGNMAGKNMGSQSISEYVTTPQGEKSKVRLPFGMGTVDVDTSEEGMAFEEFAEKKGGRLKKKKASVRKKTVAKKSSGRKRAALRGHRAELRGG